LIDIPIISKKLKLFVEKKIKYCTMSGDELHVDEGVRPGLGLEPDENIVPGAGDALSKSSILHHVLGQQAVSSAGAVEHLHGGAFVAFRYH